MRLIRLLIIAAAVSTQNAPAGEFDYLGQIKKYVKCEAVQNVAANILSKSEEEFHQHQLNHASLDSRIVAMEFARAGGYSSEHIDELFDVYLSEYRKILLASENQDEVDSFLKSLAPQIEKCEDLIEMQADIIEHKKNNIESYGEQ